jgi:hypothetical protein
LLVKVATAALLLLASCAEAKRGAAAGKVAAIKCGEPQLATAAAIIARWAVEDALAGKIQWPEHEHDALGFGLGVGTCAYAEVLRVWKSKPTVQAATLGGGPDEVAQAEAGLMRLSGGAEVVLP